MTIFERLSGYSTAMETDSFRQKNSDRLVHRTHKLMWSRRIRSHVLYSYHGAIRKEQVLKYNVKNQAGLPLSLGLNGLEKFLKYERHFRVETAQILERKEKLLRTYWGFSSAFQNTNIKETFNGKSKIHKNIYLVLQV